MKNLGYLLSINGHKIQGLRNWGGINGVMQESKCLGNEELQESRVGRQNFAWAVKFRSPAKFRMGWEHEKIFPLTC